MAAVYSRPRQHGQLLSYIIDDAMGVAGSLMQGRFQVHTQLLLFTALGLTPSMHKCCVEPCHFITFRGLHLDSNRGICSVPEEKLQYFMQLARQQLDEGQATVRQLASAAGVLASFQPAMIFAMMQSRVYYEAMAGMPCDDAIVHLTGSAQEEMEFWLQRMPAANGRAFWSAAPAAIMASDASDRRYAAYVCQGQPSAFIFQLDFTIEQRMMAQTHQLGSTLRELGAIVECLKALIRHFPQHVQHTRLQWLSDSQSGVANLTRMRGGTYDLLQAVRHVCRLAVEHGIDIDWQWRPRSDPALALADYYSKEVDTGQLSASCLLHLIWIWDLAHESP